MFHFSHKWRNLSYLHAQYQNDSKATVTLFSQTCRCGEWRIKEVAGHWMLQDGFPVANIVVQEPVK